MTDQPPQAQITRTRRALREGASPPTDSLPLRCALIDMPLAEHLLAFHPALACRGEA